MPSPVDRYFKEIKKGNPSYSDEQAWATAWSIYCKHKNPGSDHCHKDPGEYMNGKNAGISVRVAGRYLEAAAKGRTFDQARGEILELLKRHHWKVVDGLKIPHATSPSGEVRLWFKKQAVYFTTAPRHGRHDFKDARSTWVDDIRKMTPDQFYTDIERMFRPNGPMSNGAML